MTVDLVTDDIVTNRSCYNTDELWTMVTKTVVQ